MLVFVDESGDPGMKLDGGVLENAPPYLKEVHPASLVPVGA